MSFLLRRVYRKPSRGNWWVGGYSWAKPHKPRRHTIRIFRVQRPRVRRYRRLF